MKLPAGTEGLSLWLPNLGGASEVYIDGVLQQKTGVFGDWKWIRASGRNPIPIPPEIRKREAITVAVRNWNTAGPNWIPFAGAQLGPSYLMERLWHNLQLKAFQAKMTFVFLGFAEMLIALAAFAAWRGRQDHRSYFWFGLLISGFAAFNLGDCAITLGNAPEIFNPISNGLYALSLLALVKLFEGRGPSKLRSGLLYLSVLILLLAFFAVEDGVVSWVSTDILAAASILAALAVALRGVLWQRAADPDIVVLFVPVALSQLGGLNYWLDAAFKSETNFGMYGMAIPNLPFRIEYRSIGELLCILAMATVQVRRFSRLVQDKQALTGELEAAREIQNALVPATVDVPGFEFESVYLPAQQVGGDFYQILPSIEGGILILVGDVSGKGLKAAMLVSTVVGAITRASREPATLLYELNATLVGRTSGGFVTCSAVHISPDGVATVANAGHLSPYVDGVEIEIESGLPLGLVSGVEYETTTFRLEYGQRLLLISDGIIEARNAVGELFGFERVRNAGAAELAEEARRFGQEDDITAVSVLRIPAALH